MKPFFLLFASLLSLFSCEKSRDGEKKIAILIPQSHASLEKIKEGFMETLQLDESHTYTFKTYYGQGNRMLLHSEIDEIASGSFDSVLTIGSVASQMTRESFVKNHITCPQVFTCVNDPKGFKIIDSEEHPGKGVTGIKELIDLEKEVDILFSFKPSTKQVLLVYDPTSPGLENDHERLEELLRKRGAKLIAVPIFQSHEVKNKASLFASTSDAIMVLKDNTVVAALPALVLLANQHRIPLMASDLDSPENGAAIGFGVYERQFGVEAARVVQKIISEEGRCQDIPVRPVDDFYLRINRQALLNQGLSLDHLKEESHVLFTP